MKNIIFFVATTLLNAWNYHYYYLFDQYKTNQIYNSTRKNR